jgi:hypothetical protein
MLYVAHREAGSINISTTSANCSGLLFAGLTSYILDHKLIWNLLLRESLKWAEKAGYTFIMYSVVAHQDALTKILIDHSFEPMAEKYMNPRSDNTNQWYYTLIEHEDYEEPEDGYFDEEEEDF